MVYELVSCSTYLLCFIIHLTGKYDANISPILLKADLETAAEFVCLSSTTHSKWSFSPNGILEKAKSLFMGNVLNIDKVQLKDDGYYFCSGIDTDTHKPFTSMAQLKVYGKFLELSLIT